jgi:hypothetical protein
MARTRRNTISVTGSVPSRAREPHPRRGAGEPQPLDQQRHGGATAMPPKERPVEAMEKASARRALNHAKRGERHQPLAPWQSPNTTWKAKSCQARSEPTDASASARWRPVAMTKRADALDQPGLR